MGALLFTPKRTTMLQDFIQSTTVATREWFLQGDESDHDKDDEWGWGSLREDVTGDREKEGQEQG